MGVPGITLDSWEFGNLLQKDMVHFERLDVPAPGKRFLNLQIFSFFPLPVFFLRGLSPKLFNIFWRSQWIYPTQYIPEAQNVS